MLTDPTIGSIKSTQPCWKGLKNNMAKGRIIISEITRDKKINELSSDTSRLAFTWLITFADSEGRTYGDPALVRSMLFPRRDDLSTEQMQVLIQEWHDA